MVSSFQQRLSYNTLSDLALALIDGTVYEIVQGLLDIQHLTEKNLYNQRQKLHCEHQGLWTAEQETHRTRPLFQLSWFSSCLMMFDNFSTTFHRKRLLRSPEMQINLFILQASILWSRILSYSGYLSVFLCWLQTSFQHCYSININVS